VILGYQLREIPQLAEKTSEQDISAISQQVRIVAQLDTGAATNGEQAKRLRENSNGKEK
jgi:hypothetical protein